MLTIKYETTFKKDYKRILKRGYNVKLLENVIELLANRQPLPEKYRDHALTGDYETTEKVRLDAQKTIKSGSAAPLRGTGNCIL